MSVLDRFPRTPLLAGPTPLEHAPRLSEALSIDLWIKRDDLAGVSLGGNKSRQLEYYLGAAEEAEADTILITGAVQSNFVRIAAAAAARRGMRTIVQLEDRTPKTTAEYTRSGNVLLAEILGAEIMRYPEGEDEAGADRALRARAEEVRASGGRPYVIPLGLGNKPHGALGYMRAAQEIKQQAPDGFDAIIAPSGSGLTHAGLLAGLRVEGDATPILASCVRRPKAEQEARIGAVLAAIDDMIGAPTGAVRSDIRLWDEGLAPGYGLIGPKAAEAMRMAAHHEGLILDPVYTAKTFAALIGLRASGEIPAGARVLFIHTGGLAAVFAYGEDIRAALADDTS